MINEQKIAASYNNDALPNLCSVFQDEMEVNGSSGAENMTSVCVRTGCNNPAIESKDWDKEYCSNECVATHCRCVEDLTRARFNFLPTDNFSQLNISVFQRDIQGVVLHQESDHGNREIKSSGCQSHQQNCCFFH